MLVSIDDERLIAGFTTKFGGVSSKEYESLNLATHVGDDPKKVSKNREILTSKISAKKLIFMEQIHSDLVYVVDDFNQKLPPCDGVITDIKGLALCVMVADCSPVLLYDKRLNLIAAIHAGRAGVVNKIISKTVDKMGSNPSDIVAIIGPNIKQKCYNIGNMELGEFNKFIKNGYFDMDKSIEFELKNLGIKNMQFSTVCNHCDNRFYSYRKSKVTGRFAGFIMLKG